MSNSSFHEENKVFFHVPLITTELKCPSEEHLRSCILFQFHAKRNASEATRNICKVYKDALTIRKCQRWFNKFKSGNIDLKDEPKCGRPRQVDEEALREEIEKNPNLSIEKLSKRVGTSWSTTQRYLKKMGKVHREGIWVEDSALDSKRRKTIHNDEENEEREEQERRIEEWLFHPNIKIESEYSNVKEDSDCMNIKEESDYLEVKEENHHSNIEKESGG